MRISFGSDIQIVAVLIVDIEIVKNSGIALDWFNSGDRFVGLRVEFRRWYLQRVNICKLF